MDSVRFIKGRGNSVDFSFLSLFSIIFFLSLLPAVLFSSSHSLIMTVLPLWYYSSEAHSVLICFFFLSCSFFLYKHQLCYNSCTVQASLTCDPTQADVSNKAAICGGLIDEMFSCLFFNDPFMADAVPWLKKKKHNKQWKAIALFLWLVRTVKDFCSLSFIFVFVDRTGYWSVCSCVLNVERCEAGWLFSISCWKNNWNFFLRNDISRSLCSFKIMGAEGVIMEMESRFRATAGFYN